MKLTERINHEADRWREKGINLSSWGPENDSNTVRVPRTDYQPKAAPQLIATYGSERLSVSKRSETIFPAQGT